MRSVQLRIAALIALCCVFLTESGEAADPAQDPARFTLVTNWHATFTRSLSGNGNANFLRFGQDQCTASWQYSQSQTVSGQLGPPDFLGFNQWLFYWIQTDSTSLDIGDSYQDTCTGPFGNVYHDSLTAHPDQILPFEGSVNLTIDTSQKNYVLFFGISMLTRNDYVLNDRPQPNDSSSVEWSIPAAVTNSLPDTGLMLQGQQTFPLGTGLGWEMTPISTMFCDGCGLLDFSELNGNVQVTWSLSPEVEEVELIVEPKAYDKWVPKGNLPTPVQRGNSIMVTARLQKKGGGTPIARAESFEFTLSNVSKERGVCMNYPPDDQASDAPDLQFEDELNPAKPLTANSVNWSQVLIFDLYRELDQGLLEADATISSFDYGAYGEIAVTANIPGHDPIKGHLNGSSSTTISIPKTSSGSHIAEAWLNKNCGQDVRLFDDTDEDPFPEGDQHKGDGLSLYEEYRGFSINHSHVRTKPVKKDLFIRNQVASKEAQSAILQFRAASHLEVHHKLDKDEIGTDGLINFNHGWAHLVDQHGLLLVGRQKEQGHSEAVGRDGREDNSTPGSKSQLEIEPAGPGWGLDLSAGGVGGALHYSEFEFGSVAHEIGHGCSIWHQGDCDLKKVVWFPDTIGTPVIIERLRSGIERPVTVTSINGLEVTPATLFTVQLADGTRVANPYVAVLHGQHSGDISCIMCYRALDAFLRDTGGMRYLIRVWPGTRTGFCTSPAGTGVNASGTPYDAWLGDAFQAGADSPKNRGNCAGQICVNDLYVNDAKHNRDYRCPPW